MAKAPRATMLLICLLAGAEAARVKATVDQVSATEINCAKLMSKLDSLGTYLPQKVNKVETKGIDGRSGKFRIIRLGRKTNALVSAMSKYEEMGCTGDLSDVKESLEEATAKVKQLASGGGDVTAGLVAAMGQAEEEMAILKTKPVEEQEMQSRAILARFMRVVLSDGGQMTAEEESRMVGSDKSHTTDILDEAEKEDEDDAEISLLEMGDSMDLALVELAKLNMTSTGEKTTTLNIFKGLAKFIAVIVLAVLGAVWFLGAFVSGVVAAVVWATVGMVATGIVCVLWWLLGQFVEFFTLGTFSFGKDVMKCHDTLFFGQIEIGHRASEWAFDHSPWAYIDPVMDALAQISPDTNVTASDRLVPRLDRPA